MKKLILVLTLALSFSLTGCSSYEGKSGEEIAKDILSEGVALTEQGRNIAVCQGKVLAKSGLPQHVIEKITNFGDPAEGAKEFGYKKLYTKLKKCVDKSSKD